MTICRYYAKGYCRYGDRCRFEHATSNYNKQSHSNNQWNVGKYEDRYGSNYNRYDEEYNNQRYESRRYNEDYRAYDSGNYSEKFARPSGQNNQQQYRNRQGYDQQYRKNAYNFRKNQNQYSYEHENENVYGQNRYRWLSDDFKNRAHFGAEQNNYDYGNESYTTSTPKGKSSFSFKVPESEVKKGSSYMFETEESDELLIMRVQEDAKTWELSGQWPFSCYFPFPNKCAFPGFYDVSPEELRLAAYKAEKNNTSKAYVQAVENAINQVNQQRSNLQIVTPDLLTTLRNIRDGKDMYSISNKINPIAFIGSDDNNVEIMEMPDISTASNNAAASFSFKLPSLDNNVASSFSFKTPTAASNAASSFSFKLPSETDSAFKTNASSFSFKLPSSSEIQPVTTSDGDANIYTPFGNLTEEEKEQFSASTFVLGKIPTKPPSLVFCN